MRREPGHASEIDAREWINQRATDRVNEIDERIRAAATDWIKQRTIGLYRQMDGGNPVLEGTGVLLKIADAPFVVTAGHVLLAVTEARLRIGPMAGLTKPGRFVDLTAPTVEVSKDAKDDDAVVDVGYALLTDQAERELRDYGKIFLRLSELELGRDPKVGLYSVLGYPRATNVPDYAKNEIVPAWYHYGSYLSRDEVDRFVPGTSIALDWTSDMVRDQGGDMIRQPPVNGISGCGVWMLHHDHDEPHRLKAWEPSRIRLAGIEHRVVTRKWIKGTVIRQVVDYIFEKHPELRDSMRITMP